MDNENLSWDLTDTGEVRMTLRNIINYLHTESEGLRGVFGFNEFTKRVEYVKPAPWHLDGRKPRSPEVTAKDIHLIRGYLSSSVEGFHASVANIETALVSVANDNSFYPRFFDQVARWAAKQPPSRNFVTGREVFAESIDADAIFGRKDAKIIRICMKKLGWKVSYRTDYKLGLRVRGFKRRWKRRRVS